MSSEPSSGRSKGLLDRIASAFRNGESDEGSAKNDFAEALSEARANGIIAADAYSMIEGALKVPDLRASDLMIPRAQVDAIDLSQPRTE